MYIIIGLLMFMLLILIHEAGHFTAAKLSNIKVNEFSIGMGPKLKNWIKGETKYSLRLLPVGGYVAMEGEDTLSDDQRSYNNAGPWQKFVTILAGPLMNLILAFVLFTIVFMVNGVQTNTIGEIVPKSAAAKANLKVGDKIISIDGNEILTFKDASNAISQSKGRQINLIYERNGKIDSIKVSPKLDGDSYLLGFSPKLEKDFLKSIGSGFNELISTIVLLWNTLGQLFSGVLGLDNLSGPVGVIKQVSNVASYGPLALLSFTALISVNLGFFNLLPIPALDGSKLLFIIIEMIIGKPVNKKFEQIITIVGFLLLMGLIVVISIKDIYTLFI